MSGKKEIMSIQEQIKQQVAALQESTASRTITINGQGKFQIGVAESNSDTMQVVILAFVHNAAWWEAAWRPGQSSIPDCSATGALNTQYADTARPPVIQSFDSLVPTAPEDNEPQAENCGECPMNIFGSGTNGTGKACKNTYTLAVLPSNDPTGHIHTARISASGLKHMHKYLKALGTIGTTWYAVKTTLKTLPAGAGFTIEVLSKGLEPLNDDELTAFYGRIEEANKMLTYTPRDEETKTVTAPKREGAAA